MQQTVVFGFGGIAVGAISTEFGHAQAPQYATKQVRQTDLNNLPGQEILIEGEQRFEIANRRSFE